MIVKQINEKIENFVSYSVRINSNILNDLLHDYAFSRYTDKLPIKKTHLHKKMSRSKIYDMLKHEKYHNKLFFAYTNTTLIISNLSPEQYRELSQNLVYDLEKSEKS